MTNSFRLPSADLDHLVFRIPECRAVFDRVEGLKDKIKLHPNSEHLQKLLKWIRTPQTVWPIDMCGAATYVLRHIKSGKGIPRKLAFMIETLEEPPTDSASAEIFAHERMVKAGTYEPLIKAQIKFDSKEEAMANDPKFKCEWLKFKSNFNVARHQNSKGIVRRRMVQERNFRGDWKFSWAGEKQRFDVAFDTFCHRWNLYGVQHDKPLLQKLTINLTAFGTMLFIPRYWSLATSRDLNWDKIADLHRARGVPRQGRKLSQSKKERLHDSILAFKAYSEGLGEHLRGERLWKKVAAAIPRKYSERTLRRLVQAKGKAEIES